MQSSVKIKKSRGKPDNPVTKQEKKQEREDESIPVETLSIPIEEINTSILQAFQRVFQQKYDHFNALDIPAWVKTENSQALNDFFDQLTPEQKRFFIHNAWQLASSTFNALAKVAGLPIDRDKAICKSTSVKDLPHLKSLMPSISSESRGPRLSHYLLSEILIARFRLIELDKDAQPKNALVGNDFIKTWLVFCHPVLAFYKTLSLPDKTGSPHSLLNLLLSAYPSQQAVMADLLRTKEIFLQVCQLLKIDNNKEMKIVVEEINVFIDKMRQGKSDKDMTLQFLALTLQQTLYCLDGSGAFSCYLPMISLSLEPRVKDNPAVSLSEGEEAILDIADKRSLAQLPSQQLAPVSKKMLYIYYDKGRYYLLVDTDQPFLQQVTAEEKQVYLNSYQDYPQPMREYLRERLVQEDV